MTLATHAKILKPVDPEPLFMHILRIMESDPSFGRQAKWEHHDAGEQRTRFDGQPLVIEGKPWVYEAGIYQTELGQGLCGIFDVEYAVERARLGRPVDGDVAVVPTYVPATGDVVCSPEYGGEVRGVSVLEVCVARPDGTFVWVPRRRMWWNRYQEEWNVE